MGSGSKFETLLKTTDKLEEIRLEGADDVASVSHLKRQIERIDKDTEAKVAKAKAETKRAIEKIRNTPIDIALKKQQIQSAYDSLLKENARAAKERVYHAEENIKDREDNVRDAQREVEKARRDLEMVKERVEEVKNAQDLEAKQKYETNLAALGNQEQTIKLMVQEAEENGEDMVTTILSDGEKSKERLQKELDEVTEKVKVQEARLVLRQKDHDTLTKHIENLQQEQK